MECIYIERKKTFIKNKKIFHMSIFFEGIIYVYLGIVLYNIINDKG